MSAADYVRRATALGDIAKERDRQISVEGEGFAPHDDDKYDAGELATAAACYAAPEMSKPVIASPKTYPSAWPWSITWWKPTTRRRDLVKAAALIVAEIERLDRMKERT